MEKPYVVGIDIGGTNTVFGVVDARGTILYSGSIKTGKYVDIDEYVTALGEGLKGIIDQAGGPDKIKGIGVGAPNGNFFNGCIEFAPNLPWKGVIPLAQLISEKLGGLPVALTNDANAAAIGEMTYGAARGMKDFIVITLGTGVGSGIVIGGNLVYGHPDEITSKDVYDAAMKNDKLALEIFEFTGTILGEAFANFVAFSSPEAIILFGGLTKAGDLIMNPIKRAMDENMLKIYEGKTKLLFSQLKESDAAVLGASALGWEIKTAPATAEA